MDTKHPVALAWACLALGVAAMFASVWLFPVYGLLFLGAFVLAVAAMRRRRFVVGVALLLALLMVASVWVLLTVYRGATVVDDGLTHVQKRVARSIEESRTKDEHALEAQAAEAAVRHRADPALGVWAVTMWDEHGAVLQDSDPVGGFEQCDGQVVRFSVPVDQRRCWYRVFTITGGGNRGKWADDSASGWGGWFEIGGSRADLPTAPSIPFTWNDAPDDGSPPKRGVFTRH